MRRQATETTHLINKKKNDICGACKCASCGTEPPWPRVKLGSVLNSDLSPLLEMLRVEGLFTLRKDRQRERVDEFS